MLITLFIFESVQILDVTGPAQVFAGAREGGAPYEIRLVSKAGGLVTSSSGIALMSEPLDAIKREDIHTLILPGGEYPALKAVIDDVPLFDHLKDLIARVPRPVSICSGAEFLAASGLADGERLATHWSHARYMARAWPAVTIDPDAIYVESGRFWSSAGVTAGIDLSLALVARDHGATLANAIARRLVVYMQRPGQQSQFSPVLAEQGRRSAGFRDLTAWLEANLMQDIDVEAMAEQTGMTVRSFQRRFLAEIGMPPARYLLRLRVDHARSLLADPTLTIADVAHLCGLRRAETLIAAFERLFGLTPATWRRLHLAGDARDR